MLDIEIILVNDNSENKTVNLMKSLQNEDPRISILNNKKNMLTFYSRAIGVYSSKGEYIIDLDCDDTMISEDIFDITYKTAIERKLDVVAFNSFMANNVDDINNYKDVFTNKKKENYTIYQPELSCFAISKNGIEYTNDLYIWGKIFNSSIYKVALNLLGYERFSTPMIWAEDLTQIFVIYNLAKSYMSINRYGYFHKMSSGSNSNKMAKQEKVFSDIFFCDVVFEFGKPFCRTISAQRLIGLKAYWHVTKLEHKKSQEILFGLINKIMNSKDIEQKYKNKIKEDYKDICPSLTSFNITNISFIGKNISVDK